MVMVGNMLNVGGECGVIINMVLVVVFDGQIGQVVYVVFKGGVVVMMLVIVCDLLCDGICVMMIVLGIFEMLMLLGMLQEVQDVLGKMVLFLLCFGKLVEYVQFVCVIVENLMFNGEIICLDGVICMQLK